MFIEILNKGKVKEALLKRPMIQQSGIEYRYIHNLLFLTKEEEKEVMEVIEGSRQPTQLADTVATALFYAENIPARGHVDLIDTANW